MPEADSFIVSAWHDLGLFDSGEYGYKPLKFAEIEAYSKSVAHLTPFEVMALVKMSKTYINEQSEATEDLARPCLMEQNDAEFYHKLKAFKSEIVSKKMRQLAQQAK